MATVELLLQRNHKVVIIDLTINSTLEKNPNCLSLIADIQSEDEVKEALLQSITIFNRIDVLINCAGVMLVKPIFDKDSNCIHSLKSFKNVLNVNLVGTFNMCRLVIPEMTKNVPGQDGQRGVIINTSSVAGLDGLTNTIAYSASKAAVAGITLPLARELGSVGVRVMCIAPGPFKTPLVQNQKPIRNLIESIPFPKRPGNPMEFAKVILSIIENPYLNGHILRLDAGLRALNF